MQKSQARDNRALTMLTLKRIKENEKKMSDIGQAELGCQQDVRAWGGGRFILQLTFGSGVFILGAVHKGVVVKAMGLK